MASMNDIYIRSLRSSKSHESNRNLYSGELYFKRIPLGEFSEKDDDGKYFKYESQEAETLFKEKVAEYFKRKNITPHYQPEYHFIDRLIELVLTERYYISEKKKGYVGIGVTEDGRAVSIPKTLSRNKIFREFPDVTELYLKKEEFNT